MGLRLGYASEDIIEYSLRTIHVNDDSVSSRLFDGVNDSGCADDELDQAIECSRDGLTVSDGGGIRIDVIEILDDEPDGRQSSGCDDMGIRERCGVQSEWRRDGASPLVDHKWS